MFNGTRNRSSIGALLTALLLTGPSQAQEDESCDIGPETAIADAIFEIRRKVEVQGDDGVEIVAGPCLRARSSYVALARDLQESVLLDRISNGWRVTGQEAASHLRASLRSHVNDPSTQLDPTVEDLVDTTEAALNEAVTDWNGPFWFQDMWRLNPQIQDARAPWPPIEATLNANNCSSVPIGDGGECGRHYRQSLALIDHVAAMHDVVDAYTGDVRQKFVAEASQNLGRWNNFFDAVQFQYPWELAANYWISRRFGKRQPKDRYGNPLGLRVPPNGQWIILHPDVGVSYFDSEPDGDQFKASLMVQWLGYQWVQYKDDKAKNPFGISVVSTYADTPTIDKYGLGAMLHYGQFGIAVTDHGGEIAITLNFDLFRFVRNDESEAARRLRGTIPDLPDWFE